MAMWTSDQLARIESAEELKIALLRGDGTLRTPVIIWVVRQGDDLHVRSVNGCAAACFRGMQGRHAGRIWSGGVEQDVTFVEEPDPAVNDEIDAAYRAGYRRYAVSIIKIITSPAARSATIRLVPR